MPLQKQFRGLNDLFGLYSQGNLAFDLGNLVTPVFDIWDFAQPAEILENSQSLDVAGAATGNQVANETVPDTEKWRLLWAGCSVSANVVASCRVIPVALLPSSVTRMALGDMKNSWTVGLRGADGWLQPRPLILEPGTQIGWLIIQNTTGGGQPVLTTGFQIQRINL